MSRKHFEFSPSVQSALEAQQPVVALESTVIAHGLPRPLNLETARRLEQIVSDNGATPATIAILQGALHVGLTPSQIQFIADSDNIRKVSIRDLPLTTAKQLDGATTVATTSWVAYRAGVDVFATGGIGGVHRGSLPDVSADLPQLAKTPIVVVCSGAKIVLDLPATREWLETHGVTVLGYQCDEMPAFYSRQSGLPIDERVDSANEVAQILRSQRELSGEAAILVTVPVPKESEVPAEFLKEILDESLRAAEDQNIAGRNLTPFLLSRMAQQSQGATLKANISLLENNARVAAEIAVAICGQRTTGCQPVV
jgi:pseudouridine-5'-phosphate glycosidase